MTTEPQTPQTILPALETMEGTWSISRAFPRREISFFDPFLLLDHFGPIELGPGEATGIPEHPHRGFEAVSYLLSGALLHRDSKGNQGRLGPGDVQWMRTGAGILHSEMPDEDLVAHGGVLEGIQLWINLPAASKGLSPQYRDVSNGNIPVQEGPGIRFKVIAGEGNPSPTVTPITYLHVEIESGASFRHLPSAGENALVYVLNGQLSFGGALLGSHETALFAAVEGEIFAEARTPSSFIVLAGKPIGEPVARYGPFVMNTMDEIRQTLEDYREGRLG